MKTLDIPNNRPSSITRVTSGDDNYDAETTWNYRVMMKKDKDTSIEEFAIHTVFYNDGKPIAYSDTPVSPYGYSLDDIAFDIDLLSKALDQPIFDIDDFPNSIAIISRDKGENHYLTFEPTYNPDTILKVLEHVIYEDNRDPEFFIYDRYVLDWLYAVVNEIESFEKMEKSRNLVLEKRMSCNSNHCALYSCHGPCEEVIEDYQGDLHRYKLAVKEREAFENIIVNFAIDHELGYNYEYKPGGHIKPTTELKSRIAKLMDAIGKQREDHLDFEHDFIGSYELAKHNYKKYFKDSGIDVLVKKFIEEHAK